MTGTEGKKRFSLTAYFGGLTPVKKALVIVAMVLIVSGIALAIVLPLTLGGTKVAEPYFVRFDQAFDSRATLAWAPVRGASAYLVEYYYDGEERHTAYTTATRYEIDRKIGVLYAGVMAIVGDKSAFSEYARLEILPLTLSAPVVDIGDRGTVSWTPVYYRYQGVRYAVENYRVDVKIGAGEYSSIGGGRVEGFSKDLSDLLVGAIPYDEDLEEYGVTWEDVEVSVRVKALTEIDPIFTPDEKEIFLKGAYVEGDFGVKSLTITKDIYEEMKK
ncbi:MAG: hypothetical protein IJ735_05700 [Clostridia bacterium]|nr:hypothetical protein [Clostridia bacterium]